MPEFDHVLDSGKRRDFGTGSVRDVRTGKGRFDLLPWEAIERLARHYENGAVKYGDRNWEKGQPLSTYLDSGLRHLFKCLAGHTDEDHAAAAMWNVAAFITTQARIASGLLPATLNDLPTPPTDQTPPPAPRPRAVPGSVYLCGPITGVHSDSAWREAVTAVLQAEGFTVFNPMDQTRGTITDLGYTHNGEKVSTDVAHNDLHAIDQSEWLLMHWPYLPTRQSAGTLTELGYAYARGKRIVGAIDPSCGRLAEHPFITAMATLLPTPLEAAYYIIGATKD